MPESMVSQTAFRAALLDPFAPTPEGLSVTRGVDKTKRFAVYRNNVTMSLLRALEANTPMTQSLMGEDMFKSIALGFVRACPPRSRRMALYGADLAAYLSTHEALQDYPYLADMAALEHARLIAYHSADAAPLTAQAWQNLPLETLLRFPLTVHPAVQVVRSNYALWDLWHHAVALRAGEATTSEFDLEQPQDVLITRPQWDIEMQLLPAGGADLIHLLQQGMPLEAALAKHTSEETQAQAILTFIIQAHIITAIGDPP